MTTLVRTAVNAELQTAIYLNKQHIVHPFTSLNELHGIAANLAINEGEVPSLKYIAIGNKGHRSETGVDGITITKGVPHQTSDTGLYNQIPFVMRLPQNDLNAQQRNQYRLRKVLNVNGQDYIAYYLRVLDMSATVPRTELRVTTNGTTVATPFEFSQSNLRPSIPVIGTNQVLVTSGESIAVTAKVPFRISADDATELRNVATILYGNEAYAIVSELATVTGVDRLVSSEVNGSPIQYYEAVGAQIASFISTYYPFDILRDGATADLDVGNVEALLSLVDRSSLPI